MASLMPQGKQRYTDNNGNSLSGGKLYTYEAGTTTPLATYSDQAGATPNANPVVLNARGEATVFWGSSGYKAVLKDASDVEIWTQDNLYAVADQLDMANLANKTSTSLGARLIGWIRNASGAVGRWLSDKLAENLTAFDFMSEAQIADAQAGTGSVDCRVAIRNALAVGGRLRFPAGKYRFIVTTSNDFTPLAGATIEGDGDASHIAFESASTAFFNLISLNNGGITLRNIKFTWTTPVGSAGIVGLFFGSNGNIRLDRVHFDLGVAEVSGAQNAPNHLLSVSGDASNVDIIDCYFTKFKFGVLKTNTSTAINRNWEFRGNVFEEFFAPALTFNTPSGDWDDVRVLGNQLRNNLAHTIGGAPTAFPHMGGVAGGSGSGRFIFSGNVLSGTGQGLHFEEGAEDIAVTNNQFFVTDIALQIIDNNVSGTRLTPERFRITDNTIVRSGTAVTDTVTNIGIDCLFDASGQASAREIIIANNNIKGYTRGIQTAEEGQEYIIQGNIISGCTTGLRAPQSNGNIYGNTFIDCATAINNITNGGIVGINTFVNCTTPLEASGTFGLGSTGMEYVIDGVALASGSPVTITICPIGTRFACRAAFHLSSSGGGSRRYGVFDMTWDGTTLTGGGTAIVAGGSGNILAPTFEHSGGNLRMTMNNSTGAEQTCRVKVSMVGGFFV